MAMEKAFGLGFVLTPIGAGKVVAAFGAIRSSMVQLAAGMALAYAGMRLWQAGIGDALKIARGFQEGMTEVAAILGATAEETRMLTDAAIDFGMKTKFAPKEVSKAMYELSSAGLTVRDVIKVTGPVLDLAVAGHLDLRNAATAVTGAVRGFGLEMETSADILRSSTKVVDVMAMATRKSMFHMEEFQHAFATVAPEATRLNQSLEETTAMMMALRNTGMSAQMAAFKVRMALTRLVTPTAIKFLKQYGITYRDAAGQILPMTDIIESMQKALAGLGAEERDVTLSRIFGVRAMALYSTMTKATYKTTKDGTEVVYKGVDAVRAMREELINSAGTGMEFAKTMRTTLEFAINHIRGSIETLKTALTSSFLKPLWWVIMLVSNAIGVFAKLFTTKVGRVFGIALGILAMLIPAMVILGGVILFVATAYTLLHTPMIAKHIQDIKELIMASKLGTVYTWLGVKILALTTKYVWLSTAMKMTSVAGIAILGFWMAFKAATPGMAAAIGMITAALLALYAVRVGLLTLTGVGLARVVAGMVVTGAAVGLLGRKVMAAKAVPEEARAQKGGLVAKTGWAEVHRGERITPAGASVNIEAGAITVNAAPGMDEERLAEYVMDKIEERTREDRLRGIERE